jgi:CRP-like cAMP-binding protein
MLDNALARRLGTLADLENEDRARIAELCTNTHRIPGKSHISREGDRPDYVHVMMEGWGARYKTLQDGSRQIVDFVIPGDFCDLHVTLLREMDHGIVALSPCRVARINEKQIAKLTEENHRIIRAMWWSSLVDQAILREWVLNVGRRKAYGRIGHLLCEMHYRMKRVGLVENDRLSLPITQEELADATGLTSVHVNRTLKRLRAENLIELKSGMLTMLDIDALQRAAGFDSSYLHVKRRVQ